ncbi:MAG: T9SS type A sorting domain-containing protein [Bacteroidota bacterium]
MNFIRNKTHSKNSTFTYFKKISLLVNVLLFPVCIFAQNPFVVDVNLNTERSVEGASTFDRDVFINMHSSHSLNDWEAYELDEIVNDLGINFGRSVGGVTWQMNRIDEDPNNPGYFDLSHMQTLGAQTRNNYSNRTEIHPYEPKTFVMTSHTSPLFPNGTLTNEGWAPANYESVAQFYAYLLKEYFGSNGQPRPDYVEVINEPFVHSNDLNTTNAAIAEFHNVVADSIRFHHPEVKVGGYAAAWPEFEKNDFAVWDNTWRTFIDISGAQMDFFSFHIYDTPVENDEKQRKGSNSEAIFDMIEQYSMLQLGEVKPMIISEYGACCADWEGTYFEERDWRILKSVSSITMSIMERPHKILKAIPFIVQKSAWYFNSNGYPYPFVILQNLNGGSEWEYTHLRKYYELWRNVEGTRVDTWAHDPDLQIDAYVKGNKAYVILNNLEHNPRSVDLNLFENEGNVLETILIKHLYGDNEIPQLDETVTTLLPNDLSIGGEGTMILEYTFADSILLNQAQEEAKYYADAYLQNITANNPMTFNINGVNSANYGEATLRVGLGRPHGKSLHPTVTLNGTTLQVPDDWRGYDQNTRDNFFGIIEIPFDYQLLENNNTITIQLNDTGGQVSTVTMQVKNFDYDPVRTTVSTKNLVPKWANDLLIFPNPSSDWVQLKGLDTTEEISYAIFSMDGKELLQGVLASDGQAIYIEDLPSGMFQLRLSVGTETVVKKLVRL